MPGAFHYWLTHLGDPDGLSIAITIGYAAAALACALASSAASDRPRSWWRGAAWVLLLLGINKQLDLHILLAKGGREIAAAIGLVAARRTLQLLFFILLAAGALLVAPSVVARIPRSYGGAFAATGFLLIASYFIVRSGALLHVAGEKAGWTGFLHLDLEFGGLLLICGGAIAAIPRSPIDLERRAREPTGTRSTPPSKE